MDRDATQRHRELVLAQWRQEFRDLEKFSALKSWTETKKAEIENDPAYSTSVALHGYSEALKDVLDRIS